MKEHVSVDRTHVKDGSVGAITFLRDLSVVVVQLYVEERAKQHDVAILAADATAVRYAQQVPGVKRVTVCLEDEDDETNLKVNDVGHLLELVRDKPTIVMYSHRKHCDRFDVIDLDHGAACVSTYLDTAMNGIADGGLLLVTCCDTTISRGETPETCYRQYGALSLKMSEEALCDELTVRVLLKCIECHANRHGRYMEPLLSVTAGSCVRVFLRVRISPVICKQSLSKLSWVYQCVGCSTLTLHPLGAAERTNVERNAFKFTLPRGPPVGQLCQHCDHPHHVGGPVWSAPIHCPEFVSRLADRCTAQRSSTMRLSDTLTSVLRETHEACLYFTETQLRAVAGSNSSCLMDDVRVALKNAGFKVSCWHGDETTLKTDASSRDVWDVVRCWVSNQEGEEPRGKPASNILDKQPRVQADFGQPTQC